MGRSYVLQPLNSIIHLENGYFRTPTGRRCPIKGDISKLKFAEKLSDKAKQLEKNLRYVSSQQCGVQEVRHKIGNALLGARISYGEPLFVTVSPSSRHSGLVLRLSRVRPKDILRPAYLAFLLNFLGRE